MSLNTVEFGKNELNSIRLGFLELNLRCEAVCQDFPNNLTASTLEAGVLFVAEWWRSMPLRNWVQLSQ